MELFQDWQRLFRKAVLENALDDSAAVRVSGEGEDLRYTEFTPYKRWPTGKMNLASAQARKRAKILWNAVPDVVRHWHSREAQKYDLKNV